jgi:hypothetical protein
LVIPTMLKNYNDYKNLRLDAIQTFNSEFVWDAAASRYKWVDNGQYLSRELMLKLTAKQIEQTKKDLATLGDLLINRKISLAAWQEETAYALKSLHIRQAILARGGADKMVANDYLQVARTLKEEYGYLRNFAQDITEGQVSKAQFQSRLSLYAQKSRVSWELANKQNFVNNNYTIMERLLGATDRHCSDCLRYAAAGPQPIGWLPMPTQGCKCKASCQCTVRYIKSFLELLPSAE